MAFSETVELLSPAKDLPTAKAAILAGADAVYMGPPRFGARASAANSLDDFSRAASFAHLYGAKLYATLNTILTDAELDEAERLAYALYEAGADALIIQDMGLLARPLPPIEIHASTQCDVRTPQKAKFLESCGFSTIVLARELALAEISEIAKSVECRIECFAHGALCVSYSGGCYLSAAVGSRSGNRGQCAQPCRMKYSLLDSLGKRAAADAHFLSLKDFNASSKIGEMLGAGARSFKIEGRLKEAGYVKNATAYYRKILDAEIEKRGLRRASLGSSKNFFEPNIEKSFNRGFCEYFLNGESPENIASLDTPKSKGEYLGRASGELRFGFSGDFGGVSNGDGLLIKNPDGEIFGASVQTSENGKITLPKTAPKVRAGAQIWRNKNVKFEKSLSARDSERKIPIRIKISESESAYVFRFEEPSTRLFAEGQIDKSRAPAALNPEASRLALLSNISKLGQCPFEAADISCEVKSAPFLKPAQINSTRRGLAQKLESLLASHFDSARILKAPRKTFDPPQSAKDSVFTDFRANVMNEAAKSFYESKGVKIAEPALESGLISAEGRPVMRTRHCVLRELGMCKKKGLFPKGLREPLYLESAEARLRLNFRCGESCGMSVYLDKKF